MNILVDFETGSGANFKKTEFRGISHITIEHPPFEDVFPIENGDFPISFVSFHR